MVLLFPCICILPGAVGIRFFFGIYYIITMFATLGIKDVWQEMNKHRYSYIIGYIVLLCIYIAGCGYLLSSTVPETAIISRLRFDL